MADQKLEEIYSSNPITVLNDTHVFYTVDTASGVPTRGAVTYSGLINNLNDDLTFSSGVSLLNDLTDVTVPSPADGQVLTYDTVSGWIAEDSQGGGTSLTYNDSTITTSNLTCVEDNVYNCTIAGLTANRNAVLPAPSAAGKIIRINILDGDDTYKLGIIGDTGVTVNGGSTATLYRYLQRKNEFITLESTSTTNWKVIGKSINEASTVNTDADNPASTQVISATTWTKVTDVWDESNDQQGWWDGTNKRFTLPVGRYTILGHLAVTGLADQSILIAMVYKNGSGHRILGRGANSGTALYGTGGSSIIESDGDDYFELWVYCGDEATVTGQSGLAGYCHFNVIRNSD